MLISQKNLEGRWVGKVFCFYLGVGFESYLFFKKIYIYSASLSKEVVLLMTQLTPLQQMEYLDLSSKLSIQKW